MAVEDDAQAAGGAVGDSNGGIEEELAVVRRLCYAAESPRELRRAVQVRLGCVCVVILGLLKGRGARCIMGRIW